MSPELLEKQPVLQAPELPFAFDKVNHPFAVSFEIAVNPAREHHAETLDVFMHNEHETLIVDTLPSLCVEGETTGAKVDFLKAAYEAACHDLSVTFQNASEKPMKMAGWSVEGGQQRFILVHRGEREVLRNMAYVAGLDAHDMLGLEQHHPRNTARAQMIFKY